MSMLCTDVLHRYLRTAPAWITTGQGPRYVAMQVLTPAARTAASGSHDVYVRDVSIYLRRSVLEVERAPLRPSLILPQQAHRPSCL